MGPKAYPATAFTGPADHVAPQDTSRLFAAMVATSTDQMAYVDRGGIVRAVNPSFVRAANRRAKTLRGREVESTDLVGTALSEILGKDIFLSAVQPNLDRSFAGETISMQRWIDLPGSPSCYVHWQFLPCKEDSGEVVGVVSVLRDQTAEQRVQSLAAELATDESVVAGQVEEVAGLLAEQVGENLVVVDRVGVWLLRRDGRELH
ncbi:MAG: PAS domain-containing protein, partial [Thermoanaerobaculia bacterium]|nr:PAS domain-containing protein [Thermoanaerobaculia bacterium]